MPIAFARDDEGFLERKTPDPLGGADPGEGAEGLWARNLFDRNFARLPRAILLAAAWLIIQVTQQLRCAKRDLHAEYD